MAGGGGGRRGERECGWRRVVRELGEDPEVAEVSGAVVQAVALPRHAIEDVEG